MGEKIRDEIVLKLSPYLRRMYEKGYLLITNPSEGMLIVNTLNGSKIQAMPSMESSRGVRAQMNIYEESRLLKKSVITSVFEKMQSPRPAVYLTNPKYAHDKRWREQSKSVYITSARYKFEPFWEDFKNTVTNYYTSPKLKYNVFAGDIFMAIDEGVKGWGDYRKAVSGAGGTENLDFRMEDLNEMIGESEDSFFSRKSFVSNQVLINAFNPPTNLQVATGSLPENLKKGEKEVRIIVVDYAFANNNNITTKNANTIIMCMSLHWRSTGFERHVDYIEAHEASDSLGAVDRVRELFFDYQADYIIPDLRSGGEVLYNRITENWEHPQRNGVWDSRGFTISHVSEFHVANNKKLEDLRNRTVDPNAMPVIIPMVGTVDLNSTMWYELKKQIDAGNVKFLLRETEKDELLTESGEYFKQTPEEYSTAILPHIQTDLMVKEAVELTTVYRENKLTLTEPRNRTKDRIVCLSYGNYIASLIENKWNKDNQKLEEFNIDDFDLVF